MPIIIRSDLIIENSVSYTDSVQIAPGVTVTIKPGASLELGGKTILNYGTIKLEGTTTKSAKLSNGTYSTDSTSGALISNYGLIQNIDIDSFFSRGSLSLNNSVAKNSTVDALKSNRIENSLFLNSTLDIGINPVDVVKTTFYNLIRNVPQHACP